MEVSSEEAERMLRETQREGRLRRGTHVLLKLTKFEECYWPLMARHVGERAGVGVCQTGPKWGFSTSMIASTSVIGSCFAWCLAWSSAWS